MNLQSRVRMVNPRIPFSSNTNKKKSITQIQKFRQRTTKISPQFSSNYNLTTQLNQGHKKKSCNCKLV
jgi:hypothetical protein